MDHAPVKFDSGCEFRIFIYNAEGKHVSTEVNTFDNLRSGFERLLDEYHKMLYRQEVK